LCKLFKDNKEKAFSAIFKLFQIDVLNFIKIKVRGDINLSYDIYQDTALAFIKYVTERNIVFENDTKIKNLLITIAINKIRDYFRKNKRITQKTTIFKTEDEFDQCIEQIKSEIESPIENIIEKEKISALKNITAVVMAKIPENYKEVLRLKFIENKKNQEISQILNISIKAAESLIVRAKTKFKEDLINAGLKEEIFDFLEEE